jgi:hypothetical protein
MAKIGADDFRVAPPRMFSVDDVVSAVLRSHPAMKSVSYERGNLPHTIKLSVLLYPMHSGEQHDARVAAENAIKHCESRLPATVHVYIGEFRVDERGSSGSYAMRGDLDDGGMRLMALHLNKLAELGQTDASVREFVKLVQDRAIPANEALVALIEHLSKDRARLIGLFQDAERHVKDVFDAYRDNVAHALKRAVSFLSGLNLQDHPIGVQRECAAVLRRFMLALQPDRKELQRATHAWLDTAKAG